jgi:predicted dithiol-disulfide oxidoreductase (DUF899 family)
MTDHKVVSEAEWVSARRELLIKEKEFTRQRDAISAERRKLPWVRVERQYEFDTPDGKKTLAGLFGKRSQLFVYHFMLGPGWEEGCPSCSYAWVRHHDKYVDGELVDLAKPYTQPKTVTANQGDAK